MLNIQGGVDLPMASVALVANLETTMRSVVRCGSPIGASVALWREPGCPVSRDAVVIELLAEWRVLRLASKHGRHRRQRERSRHERRSQTRASPRFR
jgi:hypothetical protein